MGASNEKFCRGKGEEIFNRSKGLLARLPKGKSVPSDRPRDIASSSALRKVEGQVEGLEKKFTAFAHHADVQIQRTWKHLPHSMPLAAVKEEEAAPALIRAFYAHEV
ncbi:MAG: hypothetical protein M1826_001501 [Phylliscum demangeonii]|nr:MAG: hypothetical protein M1826_001501 [Phylliscum demangeonii]